MIIPKNVIMKIEKRINALIFDNSIAIITSKGEIFFTSFVFRDKAYVSILKMIQPPEQKDLASVLSELEANSNGKVEVEVKQNEEPEETPDTVAGGEQIPEEKIDENLQKKIDEKGSIILSMVYKEEFYKDAKLTTILNTNGKIDDVYRILFSNDNYSYKGKNYKGFWEYLKVEKSGDTEFSMTEYEPPPPKFYTTGKQLEDLPSEPKFSVKKIDFIHPMKKTSIPFMPKTCPIKEIHKIYWINNKEFQVINEVRSEKIPYSDSFFIIVLYHVLQKEKKIEINFKMQITFVKKTMMQGTIEKTVVSETSETTTQIVFPAMQEFFKNIYKSNEYQTKFPPAQKVNGEAEKEVENEKEEDEVKEIESGELENFKKKNSELEKRIENLEGKMKMVLMAVLLLIGVLGMEIVQKLFGYIFEIG